MRLAPFGPLALAVVLLVGGGAVAEAVSTSPVVKACTNNKTGAWHVVSSARQCKSNEHLLTINSQGVRGAAGPQGPAGLNGSAGPQGPAGVAGPQGAPGVSGYRLVFGPVVTYPDPLGPHVELMTVPCSVGEVALGGGAEGFIDAAATLGPSGTLLNSWPVVVNGVAVGWSSQVNAFYARAFVTCIKAP